MERIRFSTYQDACKNIITKYKYCKNIAIIAKYDEAQHVMQELIKRGCKLYNIWNFECPEVDKYTDEYVISLSDIDIEFGIWCEPLKRDSGYIYIEPNIAFIFDNCNSKVLDNCESDVKYEVSVAEGNSDDYEDDCFNSTVNEDDLFLLNRENEMYSIINEYSDGFSITKTGKTGTNSFSFFSSNRDLVDQILDLYKRL